MPIDISWMKSKKNSMEYFNGVQSFIDFARKHVKDGDLKIFCPCINCCNQCKLDQSEELSVKHHDIATFYVLQNCEESQPFVREHKNILMNAEGLLDTTWSTVNETKPRNLYEMPVDEGPYQEKTQFNSTNVNQEGNENEEDEIDWSRVEADTMIVE
ncbi:hypothetical protein Dsin_022528 [Dipteronia sinensis]|uniref:Transposase-associated domain-containing protein n=1 Tax=Dipteronia sinensis TaxID=43782 RepID=A0AAE0A1Y6_9ROSI|nr:hypothetical protein Dsin_022528 [Dipteronia sinensis]